MSIPLAGIHRFIDRRSAYRGAPAVTFDKSLRSWVVIDPALAIEALSDDRFAVVDYAAATRALAEAGGVPLDNAAFALRHIPIASDGATHVENRRSAGQHLAAQRQDIERAVSDAVARNLSAFERPGELEVVGEVLIPLVNEIIGAIVGVEISPDEPASDTSRVFDRLLGLRRHQEIDRKIGNDRKRLRQQMWPNLSQSDQGTRLALWVLGYDATLGTLGESLRYCFETANGERLNAIAFPSNPPETGVPYLARIATEDCRLGGEAIRKGDRLRVILQTSAYSEDPKQQGRIFGAGAHACLGRPLSLEIWRLITEQLGTINLRLDYLDSALRDHDHLFACPEYLRVRLLQ